MSHSSKELKAAVAIGAAITVAALAATAMPASAAVHAHPRTPAGYTVKAFAAVGAESNPDDITRLGNSIYVAFQNGVGPLGEPASNGTTTSTIAQYALDGTPGRSWPVRGKVDGLSADPSKHRLLLTTNEDGNSGFSTLTPGRKQPLKTYTYTGLTHGGGTDAISVFDGKILISASAPADSTGPAVYTVHLGANTANLTPVFSDHARAIAANGANTGQSVTLALTDPDSNTVVPAAAPRFKGDFMLDGQGDMQLVFASAHANKALQVLTVKQPVDDTAFATSAKRTLWISDPAANAIYSVTGPFKAGQALSAVTPDVGPSYLATLNLNNGSLTPVKELAAIAPKGLLFTSASQDSVRNSLK